MPETDHRALPATRASTLSNLLARQDLDRLPQRVQRAIDSHDARSEVLVRMLQLAVVAVFGALYALSPKTDAGTAFSPVPYVLAAYAVFTIAGLALAVRYKLPDFVVYAMTFVDIGLLMAMIWSFHIQYQQPPSFYLKAPTLLYVFIFIALRALRFQARFVVAAGIAAILGWATLVGYAVVIGAEHMMVTRNFVTYMTTNSILIGAEFDKIITILSVTLILALAVRRGRGLLIEAVSEQMAARELSRFFDPGVAGHIRDAESEISAGEGVTRNAAVLNIDIRGFTSLAAKMDPSHVVRVLSVYHDRIVPIVRRNGSLQVLDQHRQRRRDRRDAHHRLPLTVHDALLGSRRGCDGAPPSAETWLALDVSGRTSPPRGTSPRSSRGRASPPRSAAGGRRRGRDSRRDHLGPRPRPGRGPPLLRGARR